MLSISRFILLEELVKITSFKKSRENASNFNQFIGEYILEFFKFQAKVLIVVLEKKREYIQSYDLLHKYCLKSLKMSV